MAGQRGRLDEQLIRQKIEKTLGWISLVFAVIGVAEKTNHYVKLAQQQKKKQKIPLGFRP